MKQLLIKLNACLEAREWAEGKTIEQIVEQCHRGDWLLWLAHRVDIGLQPLTLAKGHCANTVRHLMEDERSVKAIDVAIAFGEGKATSEELNDAYADAYAAFASAAYADAYAAAAAAAYAADASANAADFASAAADFASASAAAADASAENRKQTADICRKYIGQFIIDKCNEINNLITFNTKEK